MLETYFSAVPWYKYSGGATLWKLDVNGYRVTLVRSNQGLILVERISLLFVGSDDLFEQRHVKFMSF